MTLFPATISGEVANPGVQWATLQAQVNPGAFGANQSFVAVAGNPAGIAVDGAHVYWTNTATNTIGRSNLDGSGINQSFITGANAPLAIVVDGTFVYWANEGSNAIGRALLNGTSVNQAFITGANNPQGVAVDGTFVYWSNLGTNAIGRALLNGSSPNQSFIAGATSPTGIAVDAAHIYWVNPGAGWIGRANLDGSSPNQSFITGASFPPGVAVDASHIYWANRGVNTIGRANLDGTGVNQSFIAGASQPYAIAVDSAYAYWANSAGGTLGRSVLASFDTTVQFNYGPTTSYGTTTLAQDAGSGSTPVLVTAPITALTPGTVYHFQAVATSPAGGTVLGPDAVFRTLNAPGPPGPATAQRNPFTYPAWDLVNNTALDALPYSAVSFGAPLDQPGSWQGQVSLAALSSAALAAAKTAGTGPQFSYTRATSTANTAIFVDFLGTLIWGGIIWTQGYDSSDPQKLLKVGATEFGSYFQRRIQAADYTATWAAGADPMLIAQQVISDALARGTVMGGITLTLNPAGGEGGPQITPSYPGTSLQTIDSIVGILSQMGYTIGFDYSFDCAYLPGTKTPGVTLNIWYPRKGRRAAQSGLVLLSKDCTFTYPVDGMQMATSITETGSGVGAVTPATASESIPGYPLLEQTVARSQINDEGSLAAVTLGDLGLYAFPVVAPTFTIPVTLPGPNGVVPAHAPMPFGTFDRGDDFIFRVDPVAGLGENTDPRFPLGANFEFRINSWQCNVADKGLSTLVLTAGVPPLATIPPPPPPGLM